MSSRANESANRPVARSTTGQGMLYMIAGTFLLTLQDGITKWLTADFHAGEIMFYRGLWMFPALAVLIHFNGGPRTLRLQQPAGVIWRGVAALALLFWSPCRSRTCPWPRPRPWSLSARCC